MTATPETVNTTATGSQHHFLAGLADQGRYAYDFARTGHTAEALEHLEAIERLAAAYRDALSPSAPDALPEWLYQRFARYRDHAPTWGQLTDDDRAYWGHEAAAVRRAVERGGFKPQGEA